MHRQHDLDHLVDFDDILASDEQLSPSLERLVQGLPSIEIAIDIDGLPISSDDPGDVAEWLAANPQQAENLQQTAARLQKGLVGGDDIILRISRNSSSSEDATSSHDSGSALLGEYSEEQEPTPCQRVAGKMKFLMYSIPIAEAAQSSIQTLLGLSKRPLGFSIPITLINFFSDLGIDIKYDIAGADDIFLIIKSRQLPREWVPDLTKRQEIASASLAAFLTTLSCIADSVQNYYFVMEVPEKMNFSKWKNFSPKAWKGVAITGAVFTALAILSGDGIATWKNTREMVKGVKQKYSCEISRYTSGTLGRLLGVMDSANDAVFSYAGMQFILQLENTIALYALATGSMLSAIPHYNTDGTTIVEFMDDFFGAFITPEDGNAPVYKQPKEVINFFISAPISGVFAYATEYLIRDTMRDVVDALPFKFPAIIDPLVEILIYTGTAATFIKSTGNLLPFTHILLDKAQQAAGKLYEKARNCCCANGEKDEYSSSDSSNPQREATVMTFDDSSDAEESEEEATSLSNHGLFSRHKSSSNGPPPPQQLHSFT